MNIVEKMEADLAEVQRAEGVAEGPHRSSRDENNANYAVRCAYRELYRVDYIDVARQIARAVSERYQSHVTLGPIAARNADATHRVDISDCADLAEREKDAIKNTRENRDARHDCAIVYCAAALRIDAAFAACSPNEFTAVDRLYFSSPFVARNQFRLAVKGVLRPFALEVAV